MAGGFCLPVLGQGVQKPRRAVRGAARRHEALKLPRVAGRPSPINGKNMPVDIAAFGGGKEECRVGDFSWLGRPAERDVREHLLDRILEKAVVAVKQSPCPL